MRSKIILVSVVCSIILVGARGMHAVLGTNEFSINRSTCQQSSPGEETQDLKSSYFPNSFNHVENGLALSPPTLSDSWASIEAYHIYGKAPSEFGDAPHIILPDNPAILANVKDFGAVGDGVSDDTDAIQYAIGEAAASGRSLYFPNGIYRVTRELRFEHNNGKRIGVGPHLYGESRDGVILKLDDNAPGFDDPENPTRAVIRAVQQEDGTNYQGISADFFNRYMINFTIDTGANPGAVGIKFYSNNTGVLRNIRVIGNGKIGLDLGFVGLNGPYLIQNIEVDGFDIGVHSEGPFSLSGTLSNINIRNAGSYGLYNANQVLQVEGLVVENTPVAVFNSPTAQFGRTTLTLINGRFSGSDPSKPAIVNGDVLFARNIITHGYEKALKGNGGVCGDVNSPSIDEYSSHGVSKEFVDNIDRSLSLPIRYVPITYDPDPTNWVNVQDYGALPGDNIDDTTAIQAAVDAAAAAGKTTVYFPGDPSRDPNWYSLEEDVEIYGSVSHIIGFSPARLLGNGRFKVIDDLEASEIVQFQGFNFTRTGYENASSRVMVLHNLTGFVEVTGPGQTYINSISGHLSIQHPDAEVWARQLNTEHPDIPNIVNNGGMLWVLGQKTEGGGIKAQTLNGGMTEILGALIYSVSGGNFNIIYEVIDSYASFAGIQENTNTAKYSNLIREFRGGEARLLQEEYAPAGRRANRGFSLYSASPVAELESDSSHE